MNEHEMCCGTVADKAKLCAEIEQRDRVIAAQQRRIDELLQERCSAEDNATILESALEGVVSLLNNYSGYLSECDETLHAEATLERVYRSRQRAQEAGNEQDAL